MQRNFFQRALGLGKKSKRTRTATGGAGGFVSAVGQAPAATQGAGSFVSALGMKTPAKQEESPLESGFVDDLNKGFTSVKKTIKYIPKNIKKKYKEKEAKELERQMNAGSRGSWR